MTQQEKQQQKIDEVRNQELRLQCLHIVRKNMVMDTEPQTVQELIEDAKKLEVYITEK